MTPPRLPEARLEIAADGTFRVRVSGRGYRKIDPVAFRDLYLSDAKMAAIRRRFGASHAACKSMRRSLGLPARPFARLGSPVRKPAVDQPVTIHAPENPRLHGTPAVVVELTAWGAHLSCPAAATGRYRALWDEMIFPPEPPADGTPRAREMGYTGNVCGRCQSNRMVMDGKCEKCLECGETSGGCS